MEKVFECKGKYLHFYQQDCLQGMAELLQPQSVDVVVTSPPYNLGIKYGSYDDNVSRQDYLQWMDQWAAAVKSVLAEDGSLFLNIGAKPKDPWVPFEVAGVMRRHFCLQNVIHWVKSIYIENESYGKKVALNVGHYKPINSKRYLNDTAEFIFHLTKTGRVQLDRLAIGVPYKDKSNTSRWSAGGKGVRCRGNCWYIPYQTIKYRDKDRPHPASFPPLLAEMCIRLHGLDRTRLVLDPFLGIGNAAVAAARLGKDFVGFEIDPGYLETACARLRNGAEF